MEGMDNNAQQGWVENMGNSPDNTNSEPQTAAKMSLSEAEARALLQQETQRVQGQLTPNHQKNKKLVVIVVVILVLLILIGVGFAMVMQMMTPKKISMWMDELIGVSVMDGV